MNVYKKIEIQPRKDLKYANEISFAVNLAHFSGLPGIEIRG